MANNFIRRQYVRKSDNAIIAMGNLVAKNTLQVEVWENGGVVLKVYDLTGSVVETERNEVLVVGKKTSDQSIEVLKMVEIPESGPLKGFNVTAGLSEPIGVYSSCEFKNSEEKTTQGDGRKYTAVKFRGGENKTVLLNVFYFNRMPEGERYIFVTNGKFEESEFTPTEGKNAGNTYKTFRTFALTQLV